MALVLLSSYLFTLGLYSAALSISQDTTLRKTIKKSIPELFDNIGAAQIEKVVKERVMKLVQISDIIARIVDVNIPTKKK